MKHTVVFFLLLFYGTFCANAQDTAAVKFYDFISDDSVLMYFDHRYNFTGQECARYIRHVKLDSLGNFSGPFTDYSNEQVTGKGHYISGVKDGVFEIFYPGGSIKSRGSFKNNRPSGYWNYFYPDGKTEKQLLFNLADTFLLEYYDVKGHHLVKGGNGHYEGLVGVASDPYYSTLAFASGEVVNGKADGVWTTRMGGVPAFTERFAKGVFISGKAPKQLVKDNEEYFDFSYLDILYQPSYIYRLEDFHLKQCEPGFVNFSKRNKQEGKTKSTSYNTDFESVRSYIQDAIHTVILSDQRNGNIADYQAGENLFKLSFILNDKGVPADFKRITSWGDQYFNPVSTALSMHLKTAPVSGRMYLVITITKDASNYLTSRFYFTTE